MDQETLVKSGQSVVRLMDEASFPPRLAVWVNKSDAAAWKLWIVPPRELVDKRDFYRRLAVLLSGHRTELDGMDIGDIEMVTDTQPMVQALGRMIRAPFLISAFFQSISFNGFLLPSVIVLRSNL